MGASSPASSVGAVNLIEGTPTSAPLKTTGLSSAVFSLNPATYPSYNQCRLDLGQWTKCSWFFSTGPLVNGLHTFEVQRVAPDGTVTGPTGDWVWWVDVTTPSPTNNRLETLPHCAIPYTGPTGDDREVFWSTTHTGGLYSFRYGQKAPPGEGWFYLVQGNRFPGQPGPLVATAVRPAPLSLTPGSSVYFVAPFGRNPVAGTTPGILTTWEGLGNTSEATPVPPVLPNCLAVLPPAGITANPDGTRSATFGWRNVSPWTISAPESGGSNVISPGSGTAGATPNTVTGGTATAPGQPRPTVFPPYSSGTWTYTWTPGAADASATVVWQVGSSSASFKPGAAPRIPVGSPINPFTHVNVDTPHTAPPIRVGLPAAVSTATPGQTGGDVTRLTQLAGWTRAVWPGNRTVKPGGTVRFTSRISNTGAVDAIDPRICATIPAGMTFVNSSGRASKTKRNVCWSSARLAAGASVTGSMTLRATKTARRGSRTNTVKMSAANACTQTTYAEFFVGTKPPGAKTQNAFDPVGLADTPVPSAPTGTATPHQAVTVAAEEPPATITLSTRVQSPSNRRVRPGATVSIRGTITNTSATTARNLRLCERIPVGTRVVRAPNHGPSRARTICWSTPELAAGASARGTTVLRVVKSAKIGVRANRTTVTAVNACPRTSRATFLVRR
jgi:uncharacterized repeat protein (TIGR01451 family)